MTMPPSSFWARIYWAVALLLAVWAVLALRSLGQEDAPGGRHDTLRITMLSPPPAPTAPVPEREPMPVPPRPTLPEPMALPDLAPAPVAGEGEPDAGSAAEGPGITGETSPAADAFALAGRAPGVSDPNARATMTGVRGPGGGGALDPEALQRYAAELARRLRKDQGYPRRAQRDGWQGTAVVEVHVSALARIKHVVLARSSGYDLLDEEALAKLQRLRALPTPPYPVTGRDFAVLVPIDFRLE